MHRKLATGQQPLSPPAGSPGSFAEDSTTAPGSGATSIPRRPAAFPTTRTADSHIERLRATLESDPAQPQFLVALEEAGYRLDGVCEKRLKPQTS